MSALARRTQCIIVLVDQNQPAWVTGERVSSGLGGYWPPVCAKIEQPRFSFVSSWNKHMVMCDQNDLIPQTNILNHRLRWSAMMSSSYEGGRKLWSRGYRPPRKRRSEMRVGFSSEFMNKYRGHVWSKWPCSIDEPSTPSCLLIRFSQLELRLKVCVLVSAVTDPLSAPKWNNRDLVLWVHETHTWLCVIKMIAFHRRTF